jgi:beta-galactosidase
VDRPESETTVKVYSNQNEVSLYCDGKLVDRKSGSHVFTFRVPISGEHKIEAVAGEQKDAAVIRKVDTPNPAYKLSAKSSNSANWV